MRLECRGSAGRWLNVNPIRVPKGLYKLWITQPCSHGLEAPLAIYGGKKNGKNHGLLFTISKWTAGLTFDTQRPTEQQSCYGGDLDVVYIQFKVGRDSTWFSCLRTFELRAGWKIMQKDTCLVCTMHRLQMLWTSTHSIDQLFYIFRFRYDTEDMVDGSYATSNTTSFRACQDFNSFHYLVLGHGKTRGTTCPGIEYTPCCIQGYSQPTAKKRRKSETEGSEEIVQSMPCIVCVPHIYQTGDACDRCKILYLSQKDIPSERGNSS